MSNGEIIPAPRRRLGFFSQKIVQPLLSRARASANCSIPPERLQATRRVEHRNVDALDVHRFELNFGRPAPLGMVL
jgi:hypothetical protein